jgi:hypothetical protein
VNTRLKVILLVLVVLAGIALAWLLYPRPEADLRKAWKNLVQARSFHVEASFVTASASGTFLMDVIPAAPASATSTFEIRAAGSRVRSAWAFKDGMNYALSSGSWWKSTRSPFEERVPFLDGSGGLRQLFIETSPFVIIGVPTSETEGGVALRRYQVRLTPDAVARLGSDEAQGDVRIGRWDRRIRSIGLRFKDGTTVTWRFSRYGKAADFAAPLAEDLDAKSESGNLPSNGVRGPLTDTSASATPSSATTPAVSTGDDDGDGLENSQEFFYGTDAWNPDTDADGYSDGVEVAHGMNPNGPGGLFSFGLGQ